MAVDTPLCECHGEPCYWHKDPRRRAGGIWRCRVQKRAVEKANRNERRRASQLKYWHKRDGGYIVRRRRNLAEQRADILRRLGELREAVQ